MFFPYKIEETGYDAQRYPVLTSLLCIAYIAFGGAVFGVISDQELENIAYNYGFIPSDIKWWSPLTCTFIHADWQHLLGNLCFFWIYGSALERLIGWPRFLLLYVAGAYASAFVHAWAVPLWLQDEPAIGASGAISAILGAFLVLLPHVRIRFLVFSPIYLRPLPSYGPAYFVIGFWFIAQIFMGLKLVGDIGHIAFWAHIAGFGAGAVIAWLLLRFDKDEEPQRFPSDGELGKLLRIFENSGEDASFQEALKDFEKARERHDQGAMLQLYSWMTDIFPKEILPGWLHRQAAPAALRLKNPKLALYAWANACEAKAIDDPLKALASFKTALEKSGEVELAKEASSLYDSLTPNLHRKA